MAAARESASRMSPMSGSTPGGQASSPEVSRPNTAVPRARRAALRYQPSCPETPVTSARIGLARLVAQALEVRLDHHLHEFGELDRRLPPEHLAGAAGVAD